MRAGKINKFFKITDFFLGYHCDIYDKLDSKHYNTIGNLRINEIFLLLEYSLTSRDWHTFKILKGDIIGIIFFYYTKTCKLARI